MAILVEEEKNNYSRLSGIIAWALVIAVVVFGAYYVFFKRPDIVELATPTDLREVEGLLEISISPKKIIESPAFQNLKPYVSPLNPKTTGKSNPFLAQ